MDCERFDKSSMDLLYGELDELSEAAALRHLHHCTRCRDIWGHLRTTRELAEIPQEEPPTDLFAAILAAEDSAHRSLPAKERFSRAISVLAGYAMRPQLAMAALLLLMIGSSLVFVRSGPEDHGQVSVREGGRPFSEPQDRGLSKEKKLVYQGEPAAVPKADTTAPQPEPAAKPGPSPSSTREVYSSAMAAYQEGRYAEAERLFSEVASGDGEQAGTAALHEGHAARNGSGCQRAAALYDSVSSRYAGRNISDEAASHAAACSRALGQVKPAIAHYTKLTERPAFATRAQAALETLSPQVLAQKEAAKNSSPTAPAEKTQAGAAAPVAKSSRDTGASKPTAPTTASRPAAAEDATPVAPPASATP